jgi:hypothetical protein
MDMKPVEVKCPECPHLLDDWPCACLWPRPIPPPTHEEIQARRASKPRIPLGQKLPQGHG